MKFLKTLRSSSAGRILALAVLSLTLPLGANAQNCPAFPFPFPFPPSVPFANNFENFDAMTAGSYTSFPAMAGAAWVARIGTGGLLHIDGTLLPALSPPHSMWGRGVDVLWRFSTTKRWFGGFFRAVAAGFPVTAMTVRFFNGAMPVGSVVVPISTTSWGWRGWIVPCQFDRVEIYGNGSLPGYVGMDDIRVRN